MNRFALVLLAGGVVLLVSWVAAPAAPRGLDSAPDVREALDQSGAAVAEVNAQVEKLRARLASPPSYPSPARNPFRFGARPEPRQAPVAAPDVPVIPAEVPAPALPTLLAIMSARAADGTPVRTGVLQVGDGVALVKAGDTIGAFIIRAVHADAIDVVDPSTSRVYQVVLK